MKWVLEELASWCVLNIPKCWWVFYTTGLMRLNVKYKLWSKRCLQIHNRRIKQSKLTCKSHVTPWLSHVTPQLLWKEVPYNYILVIHAFGTSSETVICIEQDSQGLGWSQVKLVSIAKDQLFFCPVVCLGLFNCKSDWLYRTLLQWDDTYRFYLNKSVLSWRRKKESFLGVTVPVTT